MRAHRIALTGGIATGKSTVAEMFADFGAVILDADKAAREVVRKGSQSWQELRDLLGVEYFEPDGALKRRKIRDRIVQDEGCRKEVNAILHPAIMQTMEREWRNILEADPASTVIFDIPLLFESGLAGRFETVILVYAPPRTQVDRLMTRDGLTRDEAQQTLSMQMPIEEKKELAQIVVDNGGDLADTRRQVRTVWERIRARK